MSLNKYDVEISNIKDYENIYIFGAGDVAREVFFCISKEPYNIRVEFFLVSKIDENTVSDIEGIPVVAYNNEKVNKSGIVIIAVLEKYRDEICNLLVENDINNHIMMTFESDCWSATRSRVFETYCTEKKYQYIFDLKKLSKSYTQQYDGNSDCSVYVVRSLKDKPLAMTFDLKSWEKEIYAGASLDNKDIEGLRDNVGLNISRKNRKYCELTVMYWIWKNTSSEYVGLSHYRRRFDFTSDEISWISSGQVDVVLTTPIINVPSVKFMYGKNHHESDWIVMKQVVDEFFPEYTSVVNIVEKSNYYVPYNMFIMKRTVFNKYCEWLFTILEKCESIIGDKDDVYQNRYIGFLAERLMTVYFEQHRKDFKVMFCNKRFLE